MKFKKLSITLLTLILVMVLSFTILAKEAELRIYHVNDVHSRVEEDDYAGSMGYAKMATLIKEARREKENVMFLDAGDTFHGQTIANINQGESISHILDLMKLDALVLGNHDFNFGQARLNELAEMSNFPFLAANLVREDGKEIPYTKDYIIKEYDGFKVGIFGLATPETAYKTHPKNVEGLKFADPVKIAQKSVDQLKDKVDVVIALSHLGISEGSDYTSKMVAENVDGIDLIIDGHSHNVVESGLMVNDTMIVMAGEYSKYLGYVDLSFADGEITDLKANLIPREATKDVEEDYIISTVVDRINRANEVITSQVVGETAVELNGARGNVRTGETNLGNLIADALRHKFEADVALTNGGGIRASIAKGEVTQGDVITVLPFGNTAMLTKVSGADLKAALEHGISEYPATEGLFPQVSGVKFSFDGDAEPGNRIKKVWVAGEKLDPNKIYTVATNDFMKAGGDGYEMFAEAPILSEAGGLEEILIEYMDANSPVAPEVEGRIMAE
ncbi:bifunctional metallophosphatase/5'-nucleotidase [Halanaerobium praevalens]|uniref:5'-Nucleotidase domain-containing protein n=1 Tax=Halanaerobium praevalens (strain ATCC 33744 / DSM 2228 / GSL) TaxID=572479 RepID=E3DMP1_HALPG|nr:5'-nucleotidase C-terminal domain-containing protein [Halanaerobium praevalens]ADO76365.1 5'-Nucleotidase domain-containing protein [Halanaerobium praevalens DSM 2228]